MLTLLRSCHDFNYNGKIVKLSLVKIVKFKIFLEVLCDKLLLLDKKIFMVMKMYLTQILSEILYYLRWHYMYLISVPNNH